MKINEYQEATEETAIYPDELPDFVNPGLVYVVLGMAGEIGEVEEKLKKAIREEDEAYIAEMERELGDVLWYFARTCEELDTKMEWVADENIEKLLDRKDREALTGQGDDR